MKVSKRAFKGTTHNVLDPGGTKGGMSHGQTYESSKSVGKALVPVQKLTPLR